MIKICALIELKKTNCRHPSNYFAIIPKLYILKSVLESVPILIYGSVYWWVLLFTQQIKELVKLSFRITIDTTLRALQFDIINDLILTKVWLFRIHKVTDAEYSLCLCMKGHPKPWYTFSFPVMSLTNFGTTLAPSLQNLSFHPFRRNACSLWYLWASLVSKYLSLECSAVFR